MVLEPVDEVIQKSVGYRSTSRCYPVPTGGTGSVYEG
jgi:hypothetical protein